MADIKSIEELGAELCTHCQLDEKHRGVRSYGKAPVYCFESALCDEAYQRYLDDMEDQNE